MNSNKGGIALIGGGLLIALFCLPISFAMAAAPPPPGQLPAACTPGVLINLKRYTPQELQAQFHITVTRPEYDNNCIQNLTFSQYLNILYIQIEPFILFLALVLIVGSGIEYMYSGPNATGKTNAKKRIIGILSGAILLALIRLIINQVINLA